MQTFKVWDELNSEESESRDIEAMDAREAAMRYAEEDEDGHADGLYVGDHGLPIGNLTRSGQPICVRAPDGSLSRFAVGVVEFDPVYGAEELPSAGGRGNG